MPGYAQLATEDLATLDLESLAGLTLDGAAPAPPGPIDTRGPNALPNAEQYCPYAATVEVFDATGTAIDLSAVPLSMDFWDPNAGTLAVAFTATTAGGLPASLVVGGAGNNAVTLALGPSLTAEAINLLWRLRPTDNSTAPYLLGSLEIDPGPPVT